MKKKCQIALFSDSSQLWKLENGILRNHEDIWISNDKWDLRKEGKGRKEVLYIGNISKNTVLGITYGGKIIAEKLEAGKFGQCWKQGKTNNEGYFSLISCECQNLMTAISSSDLEIKGK